MRPKVRSLFFALALPAFLAPASLFAQDFDDVEIESTKLSERVYMLTGAGGNMAVCVGEDGAFLIDDQYAPLTEKILAAVRALTDQPVRFLINTHWHGDHTGGNENLGEGGTILVAHENVRKRMSTKQFMEAFGQERPASPEGALPVVTFTDALTFHWNGEEIHVFHVENAHTDGDAVIHFKNDNIVHVGDTYFNGLYPFVDTSSNGSVKGVIAAADLILGMADGETKIVPGHGPLSDREELTVYRDMLRTITARIETAIAAGKTLEQVTEDGPTAEFDEKWGNAFIKPEKMVEILYTDLSR